MIRIGKSFLCTPGPRHCLDFQSHQILLEPALGGESCPDFTFLLDFLSSLFRRRLNPRLGVFEIGEPFLASDILISLLTWHGPQSAPAMLRFSSLLAPVVCARSLHLFALCFTSPRGSTATFSATRPLQLHANSHAGARKKMVNHRHSWKPKFNTRRLGLLARKKACLCRILEVKLKRRVR